jgi:hypothetical protein
VVDLTLFTAWLNDAWKITVVDADNFDLDGAVWQATADTSGTVTPRGGMNWADAWLTINSGATAARIQPGDEIRIAKTADPVSLAQNATWTDGSQTVTLTTAVTKKIEDAITGWTAATNITAGTSSNRKLGASAVSITPASGFTTGKMAYKAVDGGGTQDFSAYQYINFWFRSVNTAAFNASDFKICLCSDATGDTIVNEINFPATLANSGWNALSLNYGGNLSATVQSVAIYANVDPGTNAISINNIFASAGNLSLKTLIGKTGDVNYNIQSIDGTTIKIDSNNTAATGRGYSGATSTETLYYRVPFDVASTGTWATAQEAGASTIQYNHYTGGWDTGSNTRDGQTVIASTLVGVPTAFVFASFVKLSNLTFARFGTDNNNATKRDFENVVFCGGAQPFNSVAGSHSNFYSCKFLNLSSAINLAGVNIYKDCEFRNIASVGVSIYTASRFLNCTFANNATSSLSAATADTISTGAILLRNCTLSDSTEITFSANIFGFVWSFDHDNTQGNHWGFTNGATINWQTATFQGSDPGAWRFVLSSSSRNSFTPVTLKIAEVACAASSLVTVKAWVKKDHATNVAAKLYVEDAAYNIAGVVATSTTKANDTNWEELTITFTPTEKGIVPIFVDAWYVAGTSNVYIGSITVTQA